MGAANTVTAMQGQARTLMMGRSLPLYRKTVSVIPQGFPFGSDHPWGIKRFIRNSLTIAAGEFDIGNGAPLASAEFTTTIAADATYIGLKYNPAARTLLVFNSSTDKPISGSGVFQTWLYFFSYNGTTAQYVKHNLTGAHAALFAAATS